MDLKIDKTIDMPLLSRKRVTAWIDYSGATPSRKDIQKNLAKKSNTPEELVIIKHIYTRFGQQRAKVIANLYSKKDDIKLFEGAQAIKKNSAEEKKEEAPAAA